LRLFVNEVDWFGKRSQRQRQRDRIIVCFQNINGIFSIQKLPFKVFLTNVRDTSLHDSNNNNNKGLSNMCNIAHIKVCKNIENNNNLLKIYTFNIKSTSSNVNLLR
jgi:hypothetical protein